MHDLAAIVMMATGLFLFGWLFAECRIGAALRRHELDCHRETGEVDPDFDDDEAAATDNGAWQRYARQAQRSRRGRARGLQDQALSMTELHRKAKALAMERQG